MSGSYSEVVQYETKIKSILFNDLNYMFPAQSEESKMIIINQVFNKFGLYNRITWNVYTMKEIIDNCINLLKEL